MIRFFESIIAYIVLLICFALVIIDFSFAQTEDEIEQDEGAEYEIEYDMDECEEEYDDDEYTLGYYEDQDGFYYCVIIPTEDRGDWDNEQPEDGGFWDWDETIQAPVWRPWDFQPADENDDDDEDNDHPSDLPPGFPDDPPAEGEPGGEDAENQEHPSDLPPGLPEDDPAPEEEEEEVDPDPAPVPPWLESEEEE